MRDDPVLLRPIEEADLCTLCRLHTDPSVGEPFQWYGYRDPHMFRRRWEADGWLGGEHSMLAVGLPDGAFAGITSWRAVRTVPDGVCVEIGIVLWPEHRGHGLGTAAQRLLVEYLFSTTLVNRVQTTTDVENVAEQRTLERVGFRREGVLRGLGFIGGRWRDGVLYARLRDDPV
jgi:[ribosomal protein S5]-alanine N-acetyltransferase